MREWRRYLSQPYYWRRGIARAVEMVTRRLHLETHLDHLLAESASLPSSGSATSTAGPGAGIRLLYVVPRFDYGNPSRGYSYEENHFLPALVALGFVPIRFDSLTWVRRLGRRVASELLVEVAFRFRPEIAFFVLFKDDFEAAAVEEVRRLGCLTFNWFTDDHWRFDSFSRRWAPRFSWAITTHAPAADRYRNHGITHVIPSQWGVNHRLYRPLGRPRRYQATFIGQPHGDRRRIINALRRAGIAVDVWGYGWPSGKVTTHEAVRIIDASEVNLNLSNASVGAVSQIKGRDFEVPACRGLLLTQRVDGLERYYEPGREVLTCGGVDEIVERIRWVLRQPPEADRIREAGYQRVLRDHTYEQRFTEIFRTAGVFR